MKAQKNISITELFKESKDFFATRAKAYALFFILAVLFGNISIFALAFFGVMEHSQEHLILMIVEAFFGAYIVCSLSIYIFENLGQKSITLDKSLKEGFWASPGYLLYNLLYGFAFLAGLGLLIIPGLYIFFYFCLAGYISALEPRQKSYFSRSKQIIKGNEKTLFKFLIILFLLATIYACLSHFLVMIDPGWGVIVKVLLVSAVEIYLLCLTVLFISKN